MNGEQVVYGPHVGRCECRPWFDLLGPAGSSVDTMRFASPGGLGMVGYWRAAFVFLAILLLAATAHAADPPGLHCWPGSARTWRDCWWSSPPPVEVEVSSPYDVPPPAVWSSGRCESVVSYRVKTWNDSPPIMAHRMLAVRCDGEAVSEELIEP